MFPSQWRTLLASAPARASYVAFILALPGSGSAQPNWGAPALVSGRLSAYGPGSIAIDDASGAFDAWQAQRTSQGYIYPIETNIRPAQGAWRNPVELHDQPMTFEDYTTAPIVQGTATGAGTAVWYDSQSIWSSDRQPGGAWQAPRRLAPRPTNYDPIAFALGRNGDALVAWIAYPSPSTPALLVVSRSAGGSWTSPHPLAGIGTFTVSSIAVGSGGAAAIAGFPLGQGGAVSPALHVLTASGVGGPWLDSGALQTTHYQYAAVAVDATAQVGVVTDALDDNLVALTKPGAGAPWSTAVTIASPAYGVQSALATDDAGDATILVKDTASYQVSAVQGRLATNAWSAPAPLFTAGASPFGSVLAVAANGAAVAASSIGTQDYFSIYASVRNAASSAWSAAAALPGQTAPAQDTAYGVAVNPAGQAVVLWNAYYQQRSEYVSSTR